MAACRTKHGGGKVQKNLMNIIDNSDKLTENGKLYVLSSHYFDLLDHAIFLESVGINTFSFTGAGYLFLVSGLLGEENSTFGEFEFVLLDKKRRAITYFDEYQQASYDVIIDRLGGYDMKSIARRSVNIRNVLKKRLKFERKILKNDISFYKKNYLKFRNKKIVEEDIEKQRKKVKELERKIW